MLSHDSVPKLSKAPLTLQQGDAVEHNVLVKCRRSGLSAQGAFDQVGETLESLLREWNMALVSVLQLDDESGGQVHDYIHGVENVLVANLNWRYVVHPAQSRIRYQFNSNRWPVFTLPDISAQREPKCARLVSSMF